MQAKIIDVQIKAKPSVLKKLGASRTDFHAALDQALEALARRPENQLPRPADIQLSMSGTTRPLGDLATIAVKVARASSVKARQQDVLHEILMRQFEDAAHVRGEIDEKARTPMMLLSPGVEPDNGRMRAG